MKNKEMSLEEKFNCLEEIRSGKIKKIKKWKILSKLLRFVWLIGSLVLFILIFVLSFKSIFIPTTIGFFVLGLVLDISIAMKLTKINDLIVKEEIEKIDGLFLYKPVVFTKNSNNYYITFKLFDKTLYEAYRFDSEQWKKFNKGTRFGDYIYFNKDMMNHRLTYSMKITNFEYVDISIYYGKFGHEYLYETIIEDTEIENIDDSEIKEDNDSIEEVNNDIVDNE